VNTGDVIQFIAFMDVCMIGLPAMYLLGRRHGQDKASQKPCPHQIRSLYGEPSGEACVLTAGHSGLHEGTRGARWEAS
jgi:hypothetical protein